MPSSASIPTISLTELDQKRRLEDPQWKKKERKKNLLPKNLESSFGNFAYNTSVLKSTRMIRKEKVSQYKLNTSRQRPADMNQLISPRRVASWEYDPAGPQKAGAYTRRKIPLSEFRCRYDRGDIPVQIHHCGNNKVAWKADINTLDYNVFLPLFCDGLREKDDPYRFLAFEGTLDIVKAGKERLVPVIPNLVLPLKKALETRDTDVITLVLYILQTLVLCHPAVARSLFPPFRYVLPVLNMYKDCRRPSFSDISHESSRKSVSDLINETLQLMEIHGGKQASASIKSMVPTYESCIN